MSHPQRRCLSPLLLLLALIFLQLPKTGIARDIVPDPTSDPTLIAGGFLDSHPDLRYRMLGLKEYGERNMAKAFDLFKRASYYADKPSQAIVGEMYWAGLGAPQQDRALAYVWMELAAERGYVSFSEKRDRYWRELDPQDRTRAHEVREAIRADYADAAAEPRIATALRLGRLKMTGSRVGSQANPVQIVIPGHGSIESSRFYDSRYWDPREYRAWHDDFWKELRIGRVNVGDAQQIPGPDGPSPATDEAPSLNDDADQSHPRR